MSQLTKILIHLKMQSSEEQVSMVCIASCCPAESSAESILNQWVYTVSGSHRPVAIFTILVSHNKSTEFNVHHKTELCRMTDDIFAQAYTFL